jgi:hypothetical protein
MSLFSAVLLWKYHKLSVMKQALSRYYGNATGCTDHVTKENLICHSILSLIRLIDGATFKEPPLDTYKLGIQSNKCTLTTR